MRSKRKAGLVGAATLALAVSAAGVAMAGPATQNGVTQAVELTFKPTKVPKKATKKVDPKGGALGIGVEVQTADGSKPPPQNTVDIDMDEDFTFDTKGLPQCQEGEIVTLQADAARKQCDDALVSTKGPPVLANSPATNTSETSVGGGQTVPSIINVFNGPPEGKNPVLLLHSDTESGGNHILTIIKAEIRKGPKGFGRTIRVTVPPLAGGAASSLRFETTIKRKFKVKGKKRNLVSAVCSDRTWDFESTVTYNTDPTVNPFGVSSLSPTDEVACKGKKK